MVKRVRTLLPACAVALLALGPVAGDAAAQGPPGRVGAVPAREALAAARVIDELVERGLAANQQRPNAVVDDAAFVRRAYLGIVGRIPSLEEIEQALGSGGDAARRRLIDRLLDSPGHVSHAFNYWADVLRAKSRLARQTSGEPYIHWLKTAIDRNLPFDRFVTELLTASGPAHAEGQGATGYYLRDRGMPEDNMSNTVRVFLGTRLECAQCHNHPFDVWTQKQFFEMAAFTGGIRYQHDGVQRDRRQYQQMVRQLREEHGTQALRAFRRMMLPVAAGVGGSGAGLARLPDDYRYDDAKPRQLIAAHAMFGEDPGLEVKMPAEPRRRAGRARPQNRRNRGPQLPEIGSRAAYAAWLTSADNPRFTTVIANRMWKRVMGLGLIEPVDNMTDETRPSNPELMRYLEELMVDLDYDLVQFQRVLFYTRTAQREAARRQPRADEVYHFPGPVLRRLSAEQIWDSVLTLVVPDLDGRLLPHDARARPVYDRYEQLSGMSQEELVARVGVEMLRFTDPDRYRQMRRQERMERNRGEREAQQALQRRARELRRELAGARRARDGEREAEILAQLEQLTQGRGGRGPGRGLLRASDLPSPAPPGHLLQRFGQSDREQIEAAHDDANVPQVLTLLNGFVEQNIMRPESLLMRSIARRNSARDKIETAYLAIMGRKPEAGELRAWLRDAAELKGQAYRDLVWTLLNSHEFRFVP